MLVLGDSAKRVAHRPKRIVPRVPVDEDGIEHFRRDEAAHSASAPVVQRGDGVRGGAQSLGQGGP